MTLTDPFEIIAAFVDGERVDTVALKSALARPDGRDYLGDLVALREVVWQDGLGAGASVSRPARRWLVGAAAAILLSLGGGVMLGQRLAATREAHVSGTTTSSADVAAPPPTRVIDVAPGSSYVSKGGH